MNLADLDAIVGRAVNRINGGALLNALEMDVDGLDRPHRLAQFLAQVIHESAGLKAAEEYASGAAYEGRADLGNTQPGDGPRFKGHGLIQVTGRANHRECTAWCRGEGFPAVPDFEADPQALTRPPWSGVSALWFWTTRNLNTLCDAPEGARDRVEAITRKINGGTNGLADRQRLYTRAALHLLGRRPEDVRGFQTAAGLKADGIAGPATRKALHAALVALPVDSAPADDLLAAWKAEGLRIKREIEEWLARCPA